MHLFILYLKQLLLLKYILKNFEGVIKLMNKDILITKEMLLVWNVKNVEQQNIAKMDL